jgi:hypothetical protein
MRREIAKSEGKFTLKFIFFRLFLPILHLETKLLLSLNHVGPRCLELQNIFVSPNVQYLQKKFF